MDSHRQLKPQSAAKVLVVANRLPMIWADDVGWQSAPDGLVTALRSLRNGCVADWVGSASSLGSPPADAPAPSSFTRLHKVTVSSSVTADAIGGMSNSVLWPALHGIDEHVHYRDRYWHAYQQFNRSFTAATIKSCEIDDRVWIHDYHLLLAPKMIKSARADLRVGLSLHTPFDAASMSRLTDATAIAEALSACDLIGVQTLGDIDQLCAFLADHQREPDSVMVSPVSINPEQLVEEAVGSAFADQLCTRVGSRQLIVGVDRLDYTKAIVERLVAYDRAFRHHHIEPDDVHIVQIAQPSRTDVTDYQALRVALERVAYQLAVDWQRSDGTSPIEVHLDPLARGDVLAVLAAADIAMVTPRRDGMNLVAKEFSILTEHTAGTLVLSSRAGAAAELGPDAILVDGTNPDSVANGLDRALRLSDTQRASMATRRANTIKAWTAEDWALAYTAQLTASESSASSPRRSRAASSSSNSIA